MIRLTEPRTCLSIHFQGKAHVVFSHSFLCFSGFSFFLTYYLSRVMCLFYPDEVQGFDKQKKTKHSSKKKTKKQIHNSFIYYRFAYWINTVCSSVLESVCSVCICKAQRIVKYIDSHATRFNLYLIQHCSFLAFFSLL